MSGAVGSDQARPVHGKPHRQTLDGNVVNHLVIGALQEGRIDDGEWLETFGRKTARKCHGMLLGDADIECAVRKYLAKQIKPSARWHRPGDGDDLVVLAGF